ICEGKYHQIKRMFAAAGNGVIELKRTKMGNLSLDEDLAEVEREIKSDIRKKLDKISMRSYYTAYKTAPTEQEREEARKKYLDERGVPESFRW
ncbi:MAG: hypothetical protein UGF89_01375, partial [Acutalibacteraceae bacterium]|nr:hypothetical protein [Acutalibacteraceae bacterium]